MKKKTAKRTSSRAAVESSRDAEPWDERDEESGTERRAAGTARKKVKKKTLRSRSAADKEESPARATSGTRTTRRVRSRTADDDSSDEAPRTRVPGRRRLSGDEASGARSSAAAGRKPVVRKKKKVVSDRPRTPEAGAEEPRNEERPTRTRSRTGAEATGSTRSVSRRSSASTAEERRDGDKAPAAPRRKKKPAPPRAAETRDSGSRRSTDRRTRVDRGDRAGRSARDQASKPSANRGTASRRTDQKSSGAGRSSSVSAPARPGVETGDSKDGVRRRYAPGEGRSDRRILISTRDDQESRVCVIAENRLEELYVDKVGDNTFLGNIYLGKVVNLEPSIGAAFIDFGEGKNGFLHASDVLPMVQETRVKDFLALSENGAHTAAAAGARRPEERKNIDELLSLGDELVVQVTKDGIGHKGPTLTTYISIPGCYLVLMPNLRRTGVSRKIADSEERRRLREILRGLELPEGLGFIIRTAGEDHPRQDLERDAQFLMKMWSLITRRLKGARAPASLYRETDLILRSLRDLFTPDTVAVVVDSERHYRRCLDFMKNVMPHYADRVKLHDRPKPLFTEYNQDAEVEKVFQRKVQLSTGATIVFDQTEALVAIDVNSGKNKEESDLEETALKTNLDAIPDIVRQLRLRDLGGVVIIDFIDMLEERHRRRVERALRDELRKDRARFRMEGMSMFGIIELTRQRVRPSLFVAASATCPTCGGLGSVKSADSVSHTILRRLRGEMARQHCAEIEVRLQPRMAAYFQNTRRAALLQMEETFNKVIRITPDPMLRYEELRLAYHERPRDLGSELEHYF